MSEPAEITIHCPLCGGAIIYPPDREGEEVACPHCEDMIYLLSRELPDTPVKVNTEVKPKTVLIEPDSPSPDADTLTEEAEAKRQVSLHAATQQKVHSTTKRKAVIKRAANHPGATPPNRKKISPPESNVLKIPHLFPPVEMEREGTKVSPELILRHPVEFTLERSGGGLRKKADVWECRWTAVQVQTDRHAKPWVTLLLKAAVARPTQCHRVELKVGAKRFDLATDAAWDRAREEAETGAKEATTEGLTTIRERFSFEHDDFRYLCGELAFSEDVELTVDGIASPIDEDTCAEFREYTLEFFEALRREFPIFFR